MLLQTKSKYRTHSPFWEARVEQAAANLEKEIAVQDDLAQAKENPQRPEFYKTVDPAEEYDGMLLQTNSKNKYRHHTAQWEARVNLAAA
jgi:hypothetical protein